MISIHLTYEIDPYRQDEFEHYARLWIRLVEKFGGIHHGYFLPHEGANHLAYALFNFESLTAYEKYRQDSLSDPECQHAYAYARKTRCIKHYQRTFLKPLTKS